MEISMDSRSKIVNLCPYPVSFALPNSGREVFLKAKETATILNGELVGLCENNSNIMFAGTGDGNHARIYVENAKLREYVGYDIPEENVSPYVLTDEECKNIVEKKKMTDFKKAVKENVVCAHEKAIIMDYCRRKGLNDYNKIVFLEEYTGSKFKE